MEFRQEIECTVVTFNPREGSDRATGEVFNWTEVDLIRADGSGVISTTVGKRALNGTALAKGKKYVFTFEPKAVLGNGRAFISEKPRCVAVSEA